MIETQGYGAAQHTGREFREGGVVQVITDVSVRQGQLGLVTEIRGGSYSVVAIHPDGQERVWRPDELAVVEPTERVAEALREASLRGGVREAAGILDYCTVVAS